MAKDTHAARVADHSHVPAATLRRWLPSRRSEMYAVCTNAKGLVQTPLPLHPSIG